VRRSGHSLAELTVALFLVAFLGSVVATLLSGSLRAVTGLVERSEVAEARRTVAALLQEELGIGVPGRDWAPDGEHAIGLRAFRGYARVCGAGAEPGSWRVAWVGIRAPDPDRDSLLVLRADGGWLPAGFTGAGTAAAAGAAAPCSAGPGERVADWQVAGVPGPPVPFPSSLPWGVDPPALLLRYFERGRYSLEDGAFRYRRGAAGRQPLTPEVVASESRFHPLAGGGVEVELHLLLRPGVPAPGPDRWPVRGDPTPGMP
jgi:hypothetical protein